MKNGEIPCVLGRVISMDALCCPSDVPAHTHEFGNVTYSMQCSKNWICSNSTPQRGTAEHRLDADHAALTSRHQRPIPSCHLPIPSPNLAFKPPIKDQGQHCSGLPVSRERCARSAAGIRLEPGGFEMQYKKINVELIVVADEADVVVAELNVALDRLEERHAL